MDGIWAPRVELGLDRFLSGFADSRFKKIIRHWLALRQEDAVPHRGAVDPVQFKDSLDMVWLLERHEDGHYRYRLAGQAIADIHGGIRRGTDTESLFTPQAIDMFRSRWEAVLDHGQLIRAEGVVMLSDGRQVSRVERLMLPLRSDNGKVSVILGATSYERPRLPRLTTTDFPPTDIQRCSLTDIPLGACR
ncbi:PAS domain-containing protein [Tistlia consotensis]|uniref:PAS domain-containing protein n=1 Tax=Tistlia consotensis USBA 355 TaxID=560819 RepID=A0A1Y6B2F3_9PROT|nr:PAS domain-containing protein [Tistlia consotensis]SME88042.1 PAS domain-containing protein [Tistlia consotensis USBA 355]SNR24415.1 PAS domain-containing protein [Tistlia consotensis]